MKKLAKVVFLLLLIIMLTGCSEKMESGTSVKSNTDTTNKHGTLICNRDAEISNGSAELSYTVAYKNGYITTLHSVETVTSTDSSLLDTYEEAYKKAFKPYKDLKYYDNNVKRTNSRVISDTVIRYDRVDTAKLKEIENTEYSVIKNGKVALSDWLEFVEKFGTKCSEQ